MIREALQGALAGFVATVPMTVAMELGRRRLPRHERYPLPPRQITMKVAEQAGVRRKLREPHKFWLTALGHFGYGAVVGALYGAVAGRKMSGPVTGIAYGLCVWAGSYLGVLPALRILKPATDHPPRRNLLMVVAHAVWGSVLGELLSLLRHGDSRHESARK